MIPDKIYLYPYATDGIYEVETEPTEGHIEYIRKDALLDILRLGKEECCTVKGRRHFQSVIDRIESL